MQKHRNPEIESRIKALLVSHLGVNAETVARLGEDIPLLGNGMGLDSVEAMALASEIEFAFHIRFEDHEMTVELFRSIRSLSAAVAAKRRETGQS